MLSGAITPRRIIVMVGFITLIRVAVVMAVVQLLAFSIVMLSLNAGPGYKSPSYSHPKILVLPGLMTRR